MIKGRLLWKEIHNLQMRDERGCILITASDIDSVRRRDSPYTTSLCVPFVDDHAHPATQIEDMGCGSTNVSHNQTEVIDPQSASPQMRHEKPGYEHVFLLFRADFRAPWDTLLCLAGTSSTLSYAPLPEPEHTFVLLWGMFLRPCLKRLHLQQVEAKQESQNL
jgi:hypothetical protein